MNIEEISIGCKDHHEEVTQLNTISTGTIIKFMANHTKFGTLYLGVCTKQTRIPIALRSTINGKLRELTTVMEFLLTKNEKFRLLFVETIFECS